MEKRNKENSMKEKQRVLVSTFEYDILGDKLCLGWGMSRKGHANWRVTQKADLKRCEPKDNHQKL